jgi:tRNA nucleotidyltransferase (CCA-adding enzyme)
VNPPSTAPLPADPAEASSRLAAAPVPAAVLAAVRDLQRAGHAAVLVGGAVRDALRGAAVNDWDVATSATPQEVIETFPRTIPTGVQHGTVTVLVRLGGGKPEPVEVTTFRGEGAYADGRRPDSVVFHRSLVDDLARRDLTINALAWDPVAAAFTDPFGGLQDLRAGIVRAVGDAEQRFIEDGLRTMRAVRLCATLSMELEPATAAAIPAALPVLGKVSRERVRVELFKLLEAPVPSRGLVPMHETGMWPYVLPALEPYAREAAIDAVDRLPADAVLRVARLLWPRRDETRVLEEAIDGLKTSRAQRQRALTLCGAATVALAGATGPVAIRRAVAALGRAYLDDALLVLETGDARAAEVAAACEGAALAVGELAISGGELIAQGIVDKGPRVGECLRRLLDDVIEDPSLNTRAHLVSAARAIEG